MYKDMEVHPCKALLKVRDDVQGARNSQSGLDSLLVPKSGSGSGSCIAGYHAGPSGNSAVVVFTITDGYLCMIRSFRTAG